MTFTLPSGTLDRYRATFEPPTWQHNKSETCRYVVSDIHKQTQKLHILQRSCTRDITSPQKLTEPICSQLPTENKRSAKQYVWLPQKRCNFFATLCNYTWHFRNWERLKTREWKTRHQYAGMENEGVSSMGSQENYFLQQVESTCEIKQSETWMRMQYNKRQQLKIVAHCQNKFNMHANLKVMLLMSSIIYTLSHNRDISRQR